MDEIGLGKVAKGRLSSICWLVNKAIWKKGI
jgi:hypothetical protein